jgi:hypothetical protein
MVGNKQRYNSEVKYQWHSTFAYVLKGLPNSQVVEAGTK